MNRFEKLIKENGKCEKDGKTYALTQQPYIYGTYENPCYTAMAIDAEENEYDIRWEIIDPECEDESEACNWNYFEIVAM